MEEQETDVVEISKRTEPKELDNKEVPFEDLIAELRY